MVNFIVYSFLGWLIQSVYLSLRTRSLCNAGFLLLPLCPVFGFCMTFLVTFAYPHHLPAAVLFLACYVAAMTIEYYASLTFEQSFDVLLWDYSNRNYHLNGRVSAVWSVVWGGAATLALIWIQPEIEFLIRIPTVSGAGIAWRAIHSVLRFAASDIGFAFVFVMLADFALNIRITLLLKRRLAEMTRLREKFQYYLQQSNVCDTPREMLELNIHADSYVEAVHRKGIFAESYSAIPSEQLAATLALIKTRHQGLSHPTFLERRLLGAFPMLKVYEQSASLNELKHDEYKK